VLWASPVSYHSSLFFIEIFQKDIPMTNPHMSDLHLSGDRMSNVPVSEPMTPVPVSEPASQPVEPTKS
jgi:hypothetical protein